MIYIHHYERQDIIKYWNDIFLKQWEKYAKRFINFNKDSTWTLLLDISPNDKQIMFITHNKSTFSSNDDKHPPWVKHGVQNLRPKGKG